MAFYKKKFSPPIILLMLLVFGTIYAAGSSVTETYSTIGKSSNGLTCLDWEWTSDDSTGAVASTTGTDNTAAIQGKYVVIVITDPDGTDAPDDNYDISIQELAASGDTTGVDIMGGALQNRDTANNEQAQPLSGSIVIDRPILGALRLGVTNAGNSNKGKVRLILSNMR